MTKWIVLFLQAGMMAFQKLLSLLTRGEWPPFCSTLAVIEQDGKLLVIDRTDGQGIFFPGGFLKTWESPEQAIIREIREETGLDVEPLHLLGGYAPPQQRIKSVILCYVCTIVGGSEKNSPEGKLLWINREQGKDTLHSVCLPCLADYERYLRTKTARQ